MAPANTWRNFPALLLFGIILLIAPPLQNSANLAPGESCPERVYFPYLGSVTSANTGVNEITLERGERTYAEVTVPQRFYGALESATLEIITSAIVAPVPVTYDVYLVNSRDYTTLTNGPKVGSILLGPDTASRTMTVPLNEAFLSYLRQAAAADTQFVFLEFGGALSAAVQTNAHVTPSFARLKLGITPTNAPVFSVHPSNTALAEGMVGILYAQAEPCAELQWQLNGEDLPFARDTYHFFTAAPETVGEYRVIARNSFGAATSTVAQVTLTTAAPTLAPAERFSMNAYLGENFRSCISVLGSPAPSVQWFHNATPIAGANANCLALDNVQLTQGGTYTLYASNALGTANVTFDLTVIETKPFILAHPQFAAVVEGGTVRLENWIAGGPPPDVYIFRNGTNISLPDFTIFGATTNDAGEYYYIASNRLGTATSFVGRIEVVKAGPLDRWTEINPLPQVNPIYSIASGNGMLVGVGAQGTILRGTNATEWTIVNRRTEYDLSSVAFGAGRFVAVGPYSIMTSEDGVNWTHRAPGRYGILSVVYANDHFLAASTTGLLTSPDGITWSQMPGISVSLRAIAYGNGTYVAGNDSLYVSTNGADWFHVQATPQIENISFLNGQFVVVGDKGMILTSADGMRWQVRASGTDRRLLEISYGNGTYAAVGVRGIVLTSPEAVTWTLRNSGTPDRLEAIHFADGVFTAAGENGTTITSPDGINWTKRNFGTTRDLDGMVITPNIVVVVGKAGTILTSTNGIDFVERNSGTTNNLHGVGWNTNQFVAIGEPGVVLTSPDGIQWTARNSGVTNSLKRVKFGANMWVAVGTEGTIVFSPDGIEWDSVPRQNFTDLNDVTYGNGRFLAVGDQSLRPESALLESADGIHWENRGLLLGKNARTVQFADPYFVIGANDGLIAISTNTTTWRYVQTRVGQNIRDISFQDGQWTAVGNRGAIQTSSDLLAWKEHFSRARENLHGMGLFRGHYLAIGNRGTIIRSAAVPSSNLAVVLTDTSFEVRSAGVEGVSYELQGSSNLETWTKITEFTGANLNYQEPISAFKSAQFFRVLQK
jgi:photosystem II stability/assembly factor-like uncharacterized protein